MAKGQDLVATAMGMMTRDALEEMGMEFRWKVSTCHICHCKYDIELLFNKDEPLEDEPDAEWTGTCDPCFDDLCD